MGRAHEERAEFDFKTGRVDLRTVEIIGVKDPGDDAVGADRHSFGNVGDKEVFNVLGAGRRGSTVSRVNSSPAVNFLIGQFVPRRKHIRVFFIFHVGDFDREGLFDRVPFNERSVFLLDEFGRALTVKE